MTRPFFYEWRTDVSRNPGQLLHNRQTGRAHPPTLRTGNIWWMGPEIWTVTIDYGSDGDTADHCASFLDALAYLDAEHYEWRYVSTVNHLWTAERYMGGSGPTALFHITGRRLSVRTRRFAEIGPDQGAG